MNQLQQDSLEWTSHPLKRRPLVSVAVTLFIIFIGLIVHSLTASTFFTTAALIIMLGSLGRFYFPTGYILTESQVTIKSTTHTITRNWSTYRSFYTDNNGILLSPFTEPSRLENFRGVYMIFNDNADEVAAFVKKHIGGKETKTPQSASDVAEQNETKGEK